MVHLFGEIRQEYAQLVRGSTAPPLLESARLLARELTARMDGGPPPTLDTIATALHTTPRRIRELHLFHFRQRFVHYLHECRLEEAKVRLTGAAPISAIAYQLGWSEASNFSIAFKNHTGITPTEYRNRQQ